MAKSVVGSVGKLALEFIARAEEFRQFWQPARTVALFAHEPCADGLDCLFVICLAHIMLDEERHGGQNQPGNIFAGGEAAPM